VSDYGKLFVTGGDMTKRVLEVKKCSTCPIRVGGWCPRIGRDVTCQKKIHPLCTLPEKEYHQLKFE